MTRTDRKTLRRAHGLTEARRRAKLAPVLPMGTPSRAWALRLWATQMLGGCTALCREGGRPFAIMRLRHGFKHATGKAGYFEVESDQRDKSMYRHLLGIIHRQRGTGPKIP